MPCVSMVLAFSLLSLISATLLSPGNGSYLKARQQILSKEGSMFLGSDLNLTQDELQVDEILSSLRDRDISKSRVTGFFPPREHFFHSRTQVENSSVFKLIRRMPKGGALHLHDISSVRLEWLVANVTYRPGLYMCYDGQRLHFLFSEAEPNGTAECSWEVVAEARANASDVRSFDDMLYRNMSMVCDSPAERYPTEKSVWLRFEQVLTTASGLISHTPVFSDYIYQALTELHQDNVQYLELRSTLAPTYGPYRNSSWVLDTYQKVFRQFTDDHPDFSGGKIIYTGHRSNNLTTVMSSVKFAVSAMSKYRNFLVGYDLVGQEDPGHSLLYFLPALLQGGVAALPYFFHAGETDWEGMKVDDNLVDAILLNTSRIGHGYAITKHPLLKQMAKEKKIALEVNPISNQVLGLVSDLRNHPAASLIAESFPVVVSSDDPSVWAASGLSYDWYMAYMALCGEDGSLASLKQLAINSLEYSAMTNEEKSAAKELWGKKWSKFVSEVLQEYGW